MVFLDACFSGAKRDGKMLASSRGVAIKPNSNPVGSNTVVFSAAQGNETAYPYKLMKHGMFTYYLLKKLKETQGDITLGELAEYLNENVTRMSADKGARVQHPSASSTLVDWKSLKLK